MTVRSVLLLAKPYPLSFGLEGAVRGTGNRFLAIYERPRSASRVIKSTLRRHGWLKTADILAYSLYERIFRRAEIGAAMAAFPRPTDERLFVDSANDYSTRLRIGEFRPDVIVVHATGILRPETFLLAPVAVNLHVGVLPKYRGHDSTFWALHNGDFENIGSTLHVIDTGVDTGRIISTAHVALRPGDTDVTAWIESFNAGVALVIDFLADPEKVAPPSRSESKHWSRRGLSDYLRMRTKLSRPKV